MQVISNWNATLLLLYSTPCDSWLDPESLSLLFAWFDDWDGRGPRLVNWSGYNWKKGFLSFWDIEIINHQRTHPA